MASRRDLISALLALALISPSLAQTGPNPKTWGYIVNLPPPVVPSTCSGCDIDLGFATNQYFGCTPATCLTITRASSKTDLLPSAGAGATYNTFSNNVFAITPGVGLLIEEARTNQLLNSTAPVTQTTGALAATAQTLWVNGSGSATLSNGTATGCAGTATNGTPITFTPTAGTCTVTVTGSLNAFQLEAGAFGTSLIVTAGATATRAADLVQFAGTLNTLVGAAQGSWYSKTLNVKNTTNGVLWSRRVNVDDVILASATTSSVRAASGVRETATIGSGSYSTGVVNTVNTWNASGTALVANNGTVASSGFTYGTFFSNATGLGSDQSNYQDGYTQRFMGFSTALSNAAAQTLSAN